MCLPCCRCTASSGRPRRRNGKKGNHAVSRKTTPLSTDEAVHLGLSRDQRKRKRSHRKAARTLLRCGGFFDQFSAPGSSFYDIAQWHLSQAQLLAQR